MEGVKLRFTEDALRAIAEEAHRRKSGARGLRAIVEEVMLDAAIGAIRSIPRKGRRNLDLVAEAVRRSVRS